MTVTQSELLYFNVYQIENGLPLPTKVNVNTSDIKKFTNKLFMQDLKQTNKRYFGFSRESSEVYQLIKDIIANVDADSDTFQDLFSSKTELLAERLLEAQLRTAQKHPGINPPKVGSLVVIFQRLNNKINILLSKIDQAIYLNIEDSLYNTGLPDENATQKTCSISYEQNEDEYQLVDIIVSDTKPKLSTFWYADFLELKELSSDESNTSTAFATIENLLGTYVKKKSIGDYTELRNNLVGYFQTKESFKLSEMIDHVIGDYIPEKEEIKIEELKNRLNKLPEKKRFDTTFNIIVSQVKDRFKRTYKVSEKIEIRTSDYIKDLKDTIVAKRDESFGEKVLIIKNINEDTYNRFKVEE